MPHTTKAKLHLIVKLIPIKVYKILCHGRELLLVFTAFKTVATMVAIISANVQLTTEFMKE